MTRVAVVGLGLIGGSAALALEAAGFDRDPGVRARARSRGIAAAETLGEALAGAEVVLTAVSTAQTPGLLQEIAAIAPGVLMTDTASLKVPLIAAAQSLRAGSRFVGGHPMAGSRREGVLAADPALFRGRPWALVSTARSAPGDVTAIAELVRGIGARPLVLPADRHDRLMTWISSLPHAVAASLLRAVAAEAQPKLAVLAGPGLLDTTRIAGRRTELVLELALADPDALARAIEAVREELSRFSAALRDRDENTLRRLLGEAAVVRRALDPS